VLTGSSSKCSSSGSDGRTRNILDILALAEPLLWLLNFGIGETLANPVPPSQRSKRELCLFSVIGENDVGLVTALIIAATEADAEYYALHELGFVTVSMISLVSDAVHVGPADTMR